MKKIREKGVLFMETSPEIWAKDVIKTLGLLPDLETEYVKHELFESSENLTEIWKSQNRKISFDIKTKKDIINLRGVFVEAGLPDDEKRNVLDVLFIPENNIEEYIKEKDEKNQLKLGHLINVGTISNIKFI